MNPKPLPVLLMVNAEDYTQVGRGAAPPQPPLGVAPKAEVGSALYGQHGCPAAHKWRTAKPETPGRGAPTRSLPGTKAPGAPGAAANFGCSTKL
jgi:hypothetical protein